MPTTEMPRAADTTAEELRAKLVRIAERDRAALAERLRQVAS